MNQAFVALIFAVCAAISFLMSGMEAGVLALSPLRIRQLKRKGNPRATVLLGFLEHPENFLWTILVGNTIANFTLFAFVAVKLHEWMPTRTWAVVLIFFLLVFFFYVGLELLPKMLFRMLPNRLCLFLARPFRFIHFALSPIVGAVSWFARGLMRTPGTKFAGQLFGNREELRFVMQETAADLSSEERVMINRVLDLQTMTLRNVTIPLASTTVVSADTKMTDVLEICRQKRFTRLPVVQKQRERGRIIGIVSLKRLLYSEEIRANKTAADYVRPALYLPDTLRLEDALRRMQRAGQRLAVVLDSHQREVGIVSLQDILKTIFGEVSL